MGISTTAWVSLQHRSWLSPGQMIDRNYCALSSLPKWTYHQIRHMQLVTQTHHRGVNMAVNTRRWRSLMAILEADNHCCCFSRVQLCATPWAEVHQAPSVPGILQARILEWVATSFSNACMHAKSLSVVTNSVQPHGQQPTRFLCPQDSPGKNTGVGCHFLLLLITTPIFIKEI